MKWQLLTYKQKIKLLAVAAILLIIICYQYTFKKTWNTYDDYKENRAKAEQAGNYSSLLPGVQNEEKKINDIIKINSADTLNVQRETLAFISSFCKINGLNLDEYFPVQIAENSNFNIATRQITVEGSYRALLKLLYELENNQSYGRLSSAFFKGIEDPSSGKISLTCTFYLQNLIRK